MVTHVRITLVQRTVQHDCGYREKSIRHECFKGLRSCSTQGQKIKLIGLYINKLKMLKASPFLFFIKLVSFTSFQHEEGPSLGCWFLQACCVISVDSKEKMAPLAPDNVVDMRHPTSLFGTRRRHSR